MDNQAHSYQTGHNPLLYLACAILSPPLLLSEGEMERSNKIHLVLILCLSSHLLCAQGKKSHISHSPAPTPRKQSTPPSTTEKLLPDLQDPLLKNACSATPNPSLCLSSIAPFLAPGKNDPVSILQSEMKACLNQTIMMKDKAIKIAAMQSTPPDVASNLQSCSQLYEFIIYDLGKAEIKRPIDEEALNIGISAVMADVTTCIDDFEGSSSPSPLADLDKTLYQMFDNCLELLYFILPEKRHS